MLKEKRNIQGLTDARPLTEEDLARLEGKVHPLEGLEGGEWVNGAPRYRVHNGQVEVARVEGRGEHREVVYTPLANFAAVITRQVWVDDGSGEPEKIYEIKGYLATGEPLPLARVRASEFSGMGWVGREWGALAVVRPGQAVKDQLRAAIQFLSLARGIQGARVFRHTGWTEVEGQPIYIHAGGGIGPEGEVKGLEVELPPALGSFYLPAPPQDAAEVWAAVLDAWGKVAPAELAIPLLAYALTAPLGPTPFAAYLAGPTGARKTSLALVAQAFFGAGFTEPPAGWEATPNALEGLTFTAKDALLLVDDFAPNSDFHKGRELEAKAQRLIRAQGNRTGRTRMRADGTLAPDRPPRGALLITGEDLPPGHSVRARLLVMEVERGAIDLGTLTRLQRMAREGALASAMAAWIRHLAGLGGERGVAPWLRERVEALRPTYAVAHGRTTDALARLHATLERFRAFLAGLGVAFQLDAAVEALQALGAKQEEIQRDADPVARFRSLLAALLQTGRAYLRPAGPEVVPVNPDLYGWRERNPGVGDWAPGGAAIGWVGGNGEVYLDPLPAYRELRAFAYETGTPLPSERILWKRLAEAGEIASAVEGGEVRYKVRARVGGANRRVIKLDPLYPQKTGNTGNTSDFSVQDEENPVPGNPGVPGRTGNGKAVGDGVPGATGNTRVTGNRESAVRDAKTEAVPGVPGNLEGGYPPLHTTGQAEEEKEEEGWYRL